MRVFAVLVALTACADRPFVAIEDGGPTDDGGDPLPRAGTATLRENTIVLPAYYAREAVVHADHVIMPSGLDLPIRGVIVSASGDGFIRRVISVRDLGDGTVHVKTSPASIADAASEATFDVTITDRISTKAGLDGRNNILSAHISGELWIDPVIDVGFVLRDRDLSAFELSMTGSGAAKVEGTLAFTSPYHWAWGDERNMTDVVFRRAYALGPLPIVVVGRMRTTLAASTYMEDNVEFTSGAEAVLTVDAQSSYIPGTGWDSTQSSTFDVKQIGPVHRGPGLASLSIGITPRLEIAFYGIAGPEIALSAQQGAFGGYCGSTLITALQAGLFGDATFELEALTAVPRDVVALWNNRVSLDALEQCAP